MYALIEKVLDVKWFAINTLGNCLYNDKDRIYKLDLQELIYEHPNSLQEIFFKDKFFINDSYGKGIYFDNDFRPFVCDYYIHLFKDDFVLLSKKDGEERNTFINNIRTSDYCNIKSASTIYSLCGTYLIRKNFEFNSVEVYDFPTATPLWHYDLSTLGAYHNSSGNAKHYEVYSFIGVLGDALFVKLNAHEIIVLDIHTGTLRERLQFVDEMVGVSYLRKLTEQMPFFNTKYIVNEKKSMIVGLCSDVYYEISYVNGKTHTRAYSMKDEYDSHNIEPGNISTNNVLEGDNLYFLAYNQGRFGILNTITKKITYISDPIMIDYRADKFSQLKEIQVSEDKVYVLASDSTLHIFERESS